MSVLLVPALSAVGGATTRHLLGYPFLTAVYQWFLGNSLAALVLTPALLYWYFQGFRNLRTSKIELGLGTVGFMLSLIVTLKLAHSSFLPIALCIPFPFLVWAASDKQSVLFEFWRKMFKDQAPTPEEFSSEMLFQEGTERRWIAVQKPLVEPLTKEVQKGQRLNAYVIWIGAIKDSEDWKWLFAMNGFLAQPSTESCPQPIVDVRGPTIVAFFRPLKSDESDADANESMADFGYYAKQIRKPLSEAGIEFQEMYSDFFRVKIGNSTTTFHPDKSGVGYYLVAPGKKPRIEYGVMTDRDLRELAHEYFGR